jgi:hypothetical protein
MRTFIEFLTEAISSTSDNKDLIHRMFDHDHDGVGNIADGLEGLHKHLLGKHTTTRYTHDYKGDEISFGHHPIANRHFVSTPGQPPSFSDGDIEMRYNHNPKLKQRLKTALSELPKITPRTGGIYHGTIVHTKDDHVNKNNYVHVSNGDMTYSTPKDSSEGKKMKNSRIGAVVHSQEKGGVVTPIDNKTLSKFNEHPDVHHINPEIKSNIQNYTVNDQKEFHTHFGLAKKVYDGMKPEALESLGGHSKLLSNHLNYMIHNGLEANPDTYHNFLTDHYNEKIRTAPTTDKKDNRVKRYSELSNQLVNNKDHFGKAMKMYSHLNDAKHILMDVASKNDPYIHNQNGVAIKPKQINGYLKNGDHFNLERIKHD